MTVWVSTLFAVTQSTHALSANAADALFFLRFGVEELPVMIALTGPAAMMVMLVYSGVLTAVGSTRFLWRLAAVAGLWAVVEWWSVTLDRQFVYPFIWISTQVLMVATLTMMWGAAESCCTTRQAKRLFPLFATAGIAGGIMGNLITGPLAAWLGAPALLLVQGLLLTGSAAILLRLRRSFRPESRLETGLTAELRASITTLASNRLLRLAAIGTVAVAMLFFLVVFPFNELVAAAFDTESEVAGFLGIFSSVATALTFLVSGLATNRLFARFGLVVTLMLVPLVYVLGFSLWLGLFTLTTAVIFRSLQWVAVNAIAGTAFPALFNVLTGRRRSQVLAFVTAVPQQLGVLGGGLILIAGKSLPQEGRFVIGLLLALGLLWLVNAMRPAYVEAIVDAIRQGLVGVFGVPHAGLITPEDAIGKRLLVDHLDDPRSEARAMAFASLTRIGDISNHRIATALSDESPLVRQVALDSLCVFDTSGSADHVNAALDDPDPRLRLRGLHLAARDPDMVQGVDMTRALADSNPRVRAAAAVLAMDETGRDALQSMLGHGDAESDAAILDEIAGHAGQLGIDVVPFMSHPDHSVRASATNAYASADGESEVLLRQLDDPSMRVRAAAARGLARSAAGRGHLLGVLATGSVHTTDAALRALDPNERKGAGLGPWAGQEAMRASLLASYSRALEGAKKGAATEYLARVLRARGARLTEWAILAVTTPDRAAVMEVVERGVKSEDPETRANAIEALETVTDHSVVSLLLPLLEPGDEPRGVGAAEQALAAMTNDFDPWIRALAIRSRLEQGEDVSEMRALVAADRSDLVRTAVPSLPTMEEIDFRGIDLIDRVLALQRVPMFQDLDPEDLEIIATVATERHIPAGHRVYNEGDEGDEMLVIVDGNAIVSTVDGGSRIEITRYGAGDHVGELALLGEGRRSADVDAGGGGLFGLTLNRTDLYSILEERPAVALGLVKTLAHRLASQTQTHADSDNAGL